MEDTDKFRALLDAHHAWPCDYVFKFVVPQGREDEVIALVPGATLSRRASAHGRYIAVTAVLRVDSADAVLAVYARARGLTGIIVM